jgi:hypothetical protein
MEPSDTPPLVFAHQVIKQLVVHLVADAKIGKRGYRVVRLVFRKLGGSWFRLCMGSPTDTELLIQAVRAWGNAKSQQRQQ